MSKEKEIKLFTPAFTERVRLARRENIIEEKPIYHHPASTKTIEKCIDPSCNKPLHKYAGPHPKFDRPAPERWMEAYLIRKAKRNHWSLNIDGHKYQFLFSQLKFREEGENSRVLDLLLYEKGTGYLVIWELKYFDEPSALSRVLAKAEDELAYYCRRLGKQNLQDELMGVFNDVFNASTKIKGVKGYIVLPAQDKTDREKYNSVQFDVIEYTRIESPWEKYLKRGNNLKIDFIHVNKPK